MGTVWWWDCRMMGLTGRLMVRIELPGGEERFSKVRQFEGKVHEIDAQKLSVDEFVDLM
jgi:hypothetical protein